MHDQFRRLRIEIVRTVVKAAFRIFVLTTLVAQAAFAASTGSASLDSIPTSLLLGQLAALGHVAFSATAGPTGVGFLAGYIEHRPFFRATAADPADPSIVEELAAGGLRPVVTVRDERAAEVVDFDIFATANELVTAAVGRSSGTLSLISRLADGRIALTSRQAPLPHSSIVHRRPETESTAATLAAHAELLREMSQHNGVRPRPAPPSIFIDLDRLERRAWEELGPFAGAFVAQPAAARSLRTSIDPTGATSADVVGADRGPAPEPAPAAHGADGRNEVNVGERISAASSGRY